MFPMRDVVPKCIDVFSQYQSLSGDGLSSMPGVPDTDVVTVMVSLYPMLAPLLA